MLFSYFKVAYRNLLKYKGQSLINIIGLAIGIAFCILSYIFVRSEHSFDDFHENGDRIYLSYIHGEALGGGKLHGSTPPILAPTIKENIPGIEYIVRVFGWNIKDGTPVRHGSKVFLMRGFYVDPEFLQMFSFPQVAGDPETALKNKHAVVITRAMAKQYFGESDPMGREITVHIRGEDVLLAITGVVDLPGNSSLQFDFLVPHALRGEWSRGWGSNNVYTYIQLDRGVSAADMEGRFRNFFAGFFKESARGKDYYGSPERPLRLLPVKKLYLNTTIRKWLALRSDPLYSYILSGIALAVLLIACVNFVNLSLGLAAPRFKEVGIRKVVGAGRDQLIKQYLSESILLSFLSLILGIILALTALPTFNRLLERELSFNIQALWGPLLVITVLAGILAGFYPALLLSGFHPIEILKGRLQLKGKRRLSSTLVVLQFAFSIILIIVTVTMSWQMDYMRGRHLGFNADQVVVIDGGGWLTGLKEPEMRRVLAQYRQAVDRYPGLLSATMSTMCFGREDLWGTSMQHKDREIICRMYAVDYDYTGTLQMRLVKGREFSPEFPGDRDNSVIINERLMQLLGWDDPIGKVIPTDNKSLSGKIIGVFEDSHLRSFHYEVEPAVFHLKRMNGTFRYIFVRTRPGNLPGNLNLLRETWKEAVPYRPFIYSFLDEEVDRVFKEDGRWAGISRYAAVFAILIACLGAFGLISLAVARRTKEVGIRKVFGASQRNIAVLLAGNFSKLLLIGCLIAWPLAFFLLRRWLQDFAYRITLGPFPFIFGSILAFLIALASISIRVFKAARANPVDSLRCE